MRLPLIPVGDRGQVQGQAVVVPVFNTEAQRLIKVDGASIGDVEPIDVGPAQETDVIIHPRRSIVRV